MQLTLVIAYEGEELMPSDEYALSDSIISAIKTVADVNRETAGIAMALTPFHQTASDTEIEVLIRKATYASVIAEAQPDGAVH